MALELARVTGVLGSTFVERMTGKKYAVLTIGKESFTRHQLVTEIGVGNFSAARILSELVARLQLNSVRDLYLISPYDLAAEPGVGTTTLFVLMSLFEARGLNVLKWYGGAGKDAATPGTFTTLKHHAHKADASTPTVERVRKRKRRERVPRAERTELQPHA